MADIELIIKIPEETYRAVCDECMLPMNIIGAFRNGTPLPKGHGKIIDESTITEVYTQETEPREINGIPIYPRIEIIGTNAQTIIEAEKEE